MGGPPARGRAGCVSLLLATALLAACAARDYVPAALDQAVEPARVAAGTLGAPEQLALIAALEPGLTLPPVAWSCAELGPIAVQRAAAVTAAEAAVAAASAARAVAAQGPNPTVTVGLQYNTDEDPGDDSHWSAGPGFEYLWSPVDRGRIRAALVDDEVVVARTRVLEAAWTARHAACVAALDLHAARAEQAAAEQQIELIDAAVMQARAATAAGLADAIEWQTLALDANGHRLARLDRIGSVARAGAALAGALALPLEALAGLELAPLPDVAPLPPPAAVQAHALSHHPRVLAALAAYDSAEHDLELAVAAQYPDIALSPGYFFDQGDHVWSLLGGIVVPLVASHDAAIDAALARRDAARAAFEAEQAAVIAAVREAYGAWRAAVEVQLATRAALTAIAASVDDLRAQLTAGVGNGLMVRRAELQHAAATFKLGEAAVAARRAELALERAAALPGTGAFANYLAALYRGPPPARE
jgi:cobalt-zinc-cadmium efflux system outer membrane protein